MVRWANHDFKDADKKTVKPSPAPPVFRGTKTEWETRSQKFLVPVGATLLEIMPCLFQAASGTLDFDDFRLTPIDASEVPPPPPPPPVIQSDTMTWTNAASLPPELHVDGNQLKTKAGQVVWLQGLAVDSRMETNIPGIFAAGDGQAFPAFAFDFGDDLLQ